MIVLQDRQGNFHILDICEPNFKLSLCDQCYTENTENVFSVSYIDELPATYHMCVKCKSVQDFIRTRVIKEKTIKSYLLEKNSNKYNISKSAHSMENNFWFLGKRYWRKLTFLKRKIKRAK